MDRFIGISSIYSNGTEICLKSNMDRFIVPKANETEKYNKDLKSNMDRFIAIYRMRINYTILI